MIDYLQTWLEQVNKYMLLDIGVLLIALYILRRIAKYFISRRLVSTEDNDSKTRLRFFKNAIDFFFFLAGIVALFNIIPALKSVSMGVFASAGLFFALIGLAAQRAVANIIAGFFILGFKSFRVGDFIYVGSYYGTVEDINLRHTTIRDLENKRIIIPNFNIATDTIVNTTLHDERVCKFIDINISYETNIDRAISIVSEEAGRHKDSLDIRTPADIEAGKPKVVVRVVSLENAAVTLRAFVWCKNEITAIVMKQDLLKAIKENFDKNGIGLALPINLLMFGNKLDSNVVQKRLD